MKSPGPEAHRSTTDTRRLELEERASVPLDGIMLGYGAMLPFPAALLAFWFGGEVAGLLAVSAIQLWGSATLLFLAGVRRGLSFRTPGGPRISQIAMSLWLFLAGLVGLAVPPAAAFVVQLAGFGSLLVLDPLAARRAEAPLYFARLRPLQMAIPVGSLALLLFAL